MIEISKSIHGQCMAVRQSTLDVFFGKGGFWDPRIWMKDV